MILSKQFWAANFKGTIFYYVSVDAEVKSTKGRTPAFVKRLVEVGNCFFERNHAESVAKQLRFMLVAHQFAQNAGSDGRKIGGSWFVGQSVTLESTTHPYPGLVYQPNREVALACKEYTDRYHLNPVQKEAKDEFSKVRRKA